MKSFLKFSLLLALIVVGKLAKQPVPPALAQATPTIPTVEVVLVHQVLTSEPVLRQPPALGPYGYLRATDTMTFDSF